MTALTVDVNNITSIVLSSLLDNDLYKFSMMNAVYLTYPEVEVSYKFINRNLGMKFSYKSFNILRELINRMSVLDMSPSQFEDFKLACPYLHPMYMEALKSFRFNPKNITMFLTHDGDLDLWINGLWHETILWEVPLMAVISYVYFHYEDTDWNYDGQSERTYLKSNILEGKNWADFGTRRRRSFHIQEQMVKTGTKFSSFVGTSNVHLALENKVKPIGTMAHEWIMGISALKSLRYANRDALETWSQVYNGQLGIALTDTFGTSAFLQDFTGSIAREYDGVRHDSGDPLEFADKIISHYESQGIDPKSKTIVFSDGLDVDTCISIFNYCTGRIKFSFGIGTHLTNDFQRASKPSEKSKPMNMVIKLYSVNGINVVKLSDNPGKATGDPQMLAIAKHVFMGTSIFGDTNE